MKGHSTLLGTFCVVVFFVQTALFHGPIQTGALATGAQDSLIDLTDLPPGRSDFFSQAAFEQVNADRAALHATGRGFRIAVIDGGLDLGPNSEIDLERVYSMYDFIDGDSKPVEFQDGFDQDGDGVADDGFGHGTAVVSLLMALSIESTIAHYRVMDEEGNANTYDIALAVDLACQEGADVINLSLVTNTDDPVLRAALNKATDAGVIVVVASGNDGGTALSYPALYSNCFCVASVDRNDELVPSATNGPGVDLLAPGSALIVAYPASPTGYGVATGTSFAVPFATAGAVLLWDSRPDLTSEEIQDALTGSAALLLLSPVQSAIGVCGERVDLEAAVERAMEN